MRKIIPTAIVVLGLCASRAAQDINNLEPTQAKSEIVKELVKGSIHDRPHGKEVEWERITGKAQVIHPAVLRFSDGTPIELGRTPELSENAAKEAAKFLRKPVGGQPVTSFGYVGDTNLEHAIIINGWGLATHSSLHAAEIIVRENKRGFWRDEGIAPSKKAEQQRGMWRGKFLDPDDWRAGKRLPGER